MYITRSAKPDLQVTSKTFYDEMRLTPVRGGRIVIWRDEIENRNPFLDDERSSKALR
jgi:hypothetical protein